MLGARFQFGRGEDRFYNQMRSRRNHQNQRPRSGADPSPAVAAWSKTATSENQELESRPWPLEPSKAAASSPSASAPQNSPSSNLDRFLKSTTPSVPARYFSKPYFTLGDLWESFVEWSAYGAGVPLVLNGSDCVAQYYVPYLSAIQIYGEPSRSSLKSRRPGEDSDGDYSRDSSSDISSDCEHERGLKYVWDPESEMALRLDRLSLREKHPASVGGFSSDDSESSNSQGYLIFEYLERDLPYSREPLADKIEDLSRHFPGLKTLRSCDLSSSSWMSVAWYPIYRIPTGPTLRDLDACFLTFHSLSIPMSGSAGVNGPIVSYPDGIDGVPKVSFPVFGLASYKFKSTLCTINGGLEHQLASSLQQAAGNWLRLRKVTQPDFQFFTSHYRR